jgi:hypothetical protein
MTVSRRCNGAPRDALPAVRRQRTTKHSHCAMARQPTTNAPNRPGGCCRMNDVGPRMAGPRTAGRLSSSRPWYAARRGRRGNSATQRRVPAWTAVYAAWPSRTRQVALVAAGFRVHCSCVLRPVQPSVPEITAALAPNSQWRRFGVTEVAPAHTHTVRNRRTRCCGGHAQPPRCCGCAASR